MQITRRELAAAALAGPSALAQTASPDDLVKTARDRLKLNTDALAKVDLPMATEPAFQFKA